MMALRILEHPHPPEHSAPGCVLKAASRYLKTPIPRPMLRPPTWWMSGEIGHGDGPQVGQRAGRSLSAAAPSCCWADSGQRRRDRRVKRMADQTRSAAERPSWTTETEAGPSQQAAGAGPEIACGSASRRGDWPHPGRSLQTVTQAP